MEVEKKEMEKDWMRKKERNEEMEDRMPGMKTDGVEVEQEGDPVLRLNRPPSPPCQSDGDVCYAFQT